MDLSKVPELDLRQKLKPLNDRWNELDEQIDQLRAEHNARIGPLIREQNEVHDAISDLTDGRQVTGTCEVTGLPVLENDDVVETTTLACVAD